MAACDRRNFLKSLAVLGSGPCLAGGGAQAAGNALGVLVDIPNCIGCRKCEFACQKQAGLAVPGIETFEDNSVFHEYRRPSPDQYTTVNRYPNPADAGNPFFVKLNCFHCVEPACVSACLVGALKKESTGAITYDAWKCMGCRYCMVACPFQIPTYEYDKALTPQVRKCSFCFEKTRNGGVPACVQICPNDALIFGERAALLTEARRRIAARPKRYVQHIYGEHEAGGTSWMYLSSVPFETLGFLSLGTNPAAGLTESIQHGVFKHWFPPLALYGLLGIIMWMTRRPSEKATRTIPMVLSGIHEDQNGQADADPGHNRQSGLLMPARRDAVGAGESS